MATIELKPIVAINLEATTSEAPVYMSQIWVIIDGNFVQACVSPTQFTTTEGALAEGKANAIRAARELAKGYPGSTFVVAGANLTPEPSSNDGALDPSKIKYLPKGSLFDTAAGGPPDEGDDNGPFDPPDWMVKK